MVKTGFKFCSLILLILCFAFYGLFCLSNNDDDLEKIAVKITGEVFIKNNAYEILRVLSDEIGPRLTGSESAHRAENFSLDLFRQYGLLNAHSEQFEIVGWLPGEAHAEVLEPFAKQVVVDSMGLSSNTQVEGLTAEVVDVGHGSEEEFKKMGEAVKGKIALVGLMDPADRQKIVPEWDKIANAARHGASACIIISRLKGKLTRTRTSAQGEYSAIPAAGITYEDGTWMRRLIDHGHTIKMKLVIQNKILDKLPSANMIADIKGTEKPGEMVILCAHIDSWNLGPGAGDNGLGSSILLETARVLSSLKIRPKRTIRFILFTGEEQGLIGSMEYVRRHESELDNIILVTNLDMTGLSYPGRLNMMGCREFREELKDLLKVLEGFGIDAISNDVPFDSDDFWFIGKGVPGLGLYGRGQRDWDWGHSYADTFEKIEVDKLNMTTAAVAIIIYYASIKEERFAKRLSQQEVMQLFKDNKLDASLKKTERWQKLGFPPE
jgi:carboxypeptidase Q